MRRTFACLFYTLKSISWCLFCSRVQYQRLKRTVAEELHSQTQRILSNAANVIVWHYEICPFDHNLSSFDPSLEKIAFNLSHFSGHSCILYSDFVPNWNDTCSFFPCGCHNRLLGNLFDWVINLKAKSKNSKSEVWPLATEKNTILSPMGPTTVPPHVMLVKHFFIDFQVTKIILKLRNLICFERVQLNFDLSFPNASLNWLTQGLLTISLDAWYF